MRGMQRRSPRGSIQRGNSTRGGWCEVVRRGGTGASTSAQACWSPNVLPAPSAALAILAHRSVGSIILAHRSTMVSWIVGGEEHTLERKESFSGHEISFEGEFREGMKLSVLPGSRRLRIPISACSFVPHPASESRPHRREFDQSDEHGNADRGALMLMDDNCPWLGVADSHADAHNKVHGPMRLMADARTCR